MAGPVNEHHATPIAIVGASYAGLAVANSLHLHSIPYAVVDGKSLPFTHVTGGAKFNLPSYEHIARELKLKVTCSSDDGPTRKEVIDSLLERVRPNLITAHRIVRIENRAHLFYLHCQVQTDNSSDTRILGPYRSVVGGDGVLSKVRSSAMRGTYLVGDARWVNDRWYDLGLQRIDRGADMALQDGHELGQAIFASNMGNDHQPLSQCNMQTEARAKFCAYEIDRRRRKRQLALLITIIAVMLLKSQKGSLSVLQWISNAKDFVFEDDCLSHHDRVNPLLTFQLHTLLRDLTGLDGTYAILRPNSFFWIQLSVLILIQSIIAVIIALTIYYGIIQRRGSTSSFFLCYGTILPFAVAFPFYLIRFFNVRNRAVLVSTAATPTLVTFRCLEALYGFSPHSVEKNVANYCLYYSSVIEFVFDKETKSPAKATRRDVVQKGKSFLVNFVVVSLLLSFMESFEHRPFNTRHSGAGKYIQHIGNNFLSAVLTSSTVATGTAAFGTAICGLAGILTLDVFDAPMFRSTSVADFWGRRWNRLVHGVLKRGVYKPVRKHSSSKILASLATFIMSGILHEYVLLLISMPSWAYDENPDTYTNYSPTYGSQFCFFAWNGMLIALEYLYINSALAHRLKLSAPPIIKSMLVILLALPVAHLFTNEYVRSGLFSHYAVGFPTIVRLK